MTAKGALGVLLVAVVAAQCPTFDPSGVPNCLQKTDNELCVLASHKDNDRLADFEFTEELVDADPLACKMRSAAIRQHVLYHGIEDSAPLTCKRAAAIFKTNYLPKKNLKIQDVCEQIGFPACKGICRHGGTPIIKDDGSCKSCDCHSGWGGRFCDECILQEAECLNKGHLVVETGICECSCQYPFNGVHCEQCNRRCNNGGYADPADRLCNCKCPEPWSGPECNKCGLKCQHNGTLVITNVSATTKTCECDCPVLAKGAQCEQCTARCLNGGVLDKSTCTCQCSGGFTGDRCEVCPLECKFGSTFFSELCSCYCTNPWTKGPECEICGNKCNDRGVETNCTCHDCEGFWDGTACDVCTLACVNEGNLNSKTCACSCDVSKCKNGDVTDDCSCVCDGYWRGEGCDKCNINCVHGTVDPGECICKCDGFFTGARCDVCDKDCEARGLLDQAQCVCDDCVSPYYGYDCAKKCSKDCRHGSYLNIKTCICEQCILPWMGPECDTCQLLIDSYGEQPCKHGTFDSDNCTCHCEAGYGGELCDQCVIDCVHGVADDTVCACNCDRFWNGTNCDECVIECQNGGVMDPEFCYCQCDSLHSGTFCQGGQCDMQIACDSCLSVSDGCEWCAQTSSCAQKPSPDQNSTCEGPNRTGICPVYGECHTCDYTSEELTWLSSHGHATAGAPMSSPGEMDNAEDFIQECVRPGYTWCHLSARCINTPCTGVMVGNDVAVTAKNALVGSMDLVANSPKAALIAQMMNLPRAVAAVAEEEPVVEDASAA